MSLDLVPNTANPGAPGKCVQCGRSSGHIEEPFCEDCEGDLTSRECECCGCEMGYQSGHFCAVCLTYEF